MILFNYVFQKINPIRHPLSQHTLIFTIKYKCILECLSAQRKRRTTTAYSQHVTLTSTNKEKCDIGKVAETQQDT